MTYVHPFESAPVQRGNENDMKRELWTSPRSPPAAAAKLGRGVWGGGVVVGLTTDLRLALPSSAFSAAECHLN